MRLVRDSSRTGHVPYGTRPVPDASCAGRVLSGTHLVWDASGTGRDPYSTGPVRDASYTGRVTYRTRAEDSLQDSLDGPVPAVFSDGPCGQQNVIFQGGGGEAGKFNWHEL